MKRLRPGVWLAVSCGLFSMVLLGGCPGTLDPGVGVGLGGTGGSSGTNNCQVPILASCGLCHVPNGSAGLDLQSANPGTRLVGVPSSTNTSLGAMCAGKTLLVAGSNPAMGLFIDKITNAQDCGSAMPIGPALSADELTCLTTWATSLTSPPAAFTDEGAQ